MTDSFWAFQHLLPKIQGTPFPWVLSGLPLLSNLYHQQICEMWTSWFPWRVPFETAFWWSLLKPIKGRKETIYINFIKILFIYLFGCIGSQLPLAGSRAHRRSSCRPTWCSCPKATLSDRNYQSFENDWKSSSIQSFSNSPQVWGLPPADGNRHFRYWCSEWGILSSCLLSLHNEE